MAESSEKPARVSLLALPESSGSVLYGLYDVFTASGSVWSQITGSEESTPGLAVEIVAPTKAPFRCLGGIPVEPQAGLAP